MAANKIIYPLKNSKKINDYNPNVDPAAFNEYANAAFRCGHSQIVGNLK